MYTCTRMTRLVVRYLCEGVRNKLRRVKYIIYSNFELFHYSTYILWTGVSSTSNIG